MLRSYLTLAIRTLRRRLGYTAVNVLGLTVGLACCAMVAVFLQYEATYDAHHEDADRIYRLLRDYRSSTYSTIPFEGFWSADGPTQRALATRLPESVPAVEQATNFEILSNNPRFVTTEDGDRYESDRQLVTTTGPAFADLFTFDRVAGAPLGEALSKPGSAVLTQTTARKYFGDANPIGETLTVGSTTATVRAVIADPPPNSRITFDLALQLEEIPNWGAYHYVRLVEGADPEAVVPQISALMDETRPSRVEDEYVRSNLRGEHLQALTDIHFADRALYDDTPHREPAYLWAFAAIGLLILVITSINYANLALALYADRNGEIGVRKAVGGHRAQIAGQFLAEAALLALTCVPLALLTCSAALPGFNALMNTSIEATRLLHPAVLGGMVGLALITGLVAGGYPAFVLARKRAVDLFDRAVSASSGEGRGWSVRHGLIALQFVVLIGLGSLSWIAYDQIQFMQSGDLGFQTEGVVEISNLRADSSTYLQFRDRLLAASAIEAVGSGRTPSEGLNRGNYRAAGSDVVHSDVYSHDVDVGWFEAMGIEHPVVEAMREAGASAPTRVLINRTAADRFGFDRAAAQEIIAGPNGDDPLRKTVDGVIDDLHLRPMDQKIKPLVLDVVPARETAFNAVVRLAPGRTQAGLEHIREVWSEVKPDTPIQTTFLSEDVARLYEQEQRFGTLSAVLAGLAILLAVIGLASLVAYLTRLRMKEIGVRKALGGSTLSIVALFNKEYVQIVGVAFLAGTPLAWTVADWWLGRFAYRIDLSVLPFAAAGLGALAVAVTAVSLQALRAARVDPASVLRSE